MKFHSKSTIPKIAFLVNRYPTVPHTFILREVLNLRNKGDFEIWTASLSDPDRPKDRLSEEEWLEMKKTVYIKSKGFFSRTAAFFYFLGKCPGRLLKTFGFAISLGKNRFG